MGDRIGEVLEGKYRLRRRLERGGMGLVYEAEHTVISRRVAVTMLHGEDVTSVFRERFADGPVAHRIPGSLGSAMRSMQ